MSRVQGSAATATTITTTTTTTSTSAAWQRQRQQRRRHCWRESLKKCIIIKCVNYSVHSKRRAVRGADFCAELYWKNRNKLMSNCWTKKKQTLRVRENWRASVCVCVECVECICLLCRESKVLKSSLIVINYIHKATNTRSRGHSHW